MRKILLALILICFFNEIRAQQVTLLSEGFEGTFPPTGWLLMDAAGPPPIFPWVKQNGRGANPNALPKTDTCTAMFECFAYPAGYSSYMITDAISLVGKTNAQVNFSMYRNFGAGNPFTAPADQVVIHAGIIQDIAGAVALGVVQRNRQLQPPEATNGWYDYSFEIPMEVFADGDVFIIIEGHSQFGNNIYIDDFSVTTTLAVPACASNLMPEDGTNNLCTSYDITLSWDAVADATGYKLFLGTDDPPTDIENGTDLGDVLTYNLPAPLNSNTTFNWQVVPYNTDGDAIGCPVFEFSTNPNPDPVVNIISDSIATCINDSVVLSSSVTGGNLIIPDDYTIDWTGTDLSKLSSRVVINTKFGSNVKDEQFTYYLTATDDSLCQGFDSVIVYVKGFPDAGVITADKDTICDGDQVQLSIAGEDGTVSWNTSGDAITYSPVGSSANPYTTSYNTGLYYMMAVVEKFNCYDTTNVVEIRAYDIPAKPIVDAPILNFCEGDSVLLSVTNYTTNLLWSDGVTTASNLYTSASGTYNVTYTDGVSGCEAISDDVVINEIVVAKPLIAATELSFCENSSSVLYCTNYSNNLIWNDLNATQNDSLMVTESGDYKVYYTEPIIGCIDSSEALTITKYSQPNTPIVTQSMDTLYSSISGNITWYNDLDQEVGTGSFFKVLANGTYYAVYIDGNGCSAVSEDFVVTNVGISDIAKLATISVYPNPSNGEIYIDNAVNSEITLLNTYGTIVLRVNAASNHHLIDVDIVSGIYLLRVVKDKKIITKRVIIE